MRVTLFSKLFRHLAKLDLAPSTDAEDSQQTRALAHDAVVAAREAGRRAPKKPAAPGKMALILQRIASDSAFLTTADHDALAATLGVFSDTAIDPVDLAATASNGLVNALIHARISALIGFPARFFVSSSKGDEEEDRKCWFKVGPHPDRIRIPVSASDLAEGIRSGEYSRSAVRAMGYVMGQQGPRTIMEFEAASKGSDIANGGALAAVVDCSVQIHSLLARYRMNKSVYAAIDVRPARLPAEAGDADADAGLESKAIPLRAPTPRQRAPGASKAAG